MSNPTSNFNWQMPTATDLVTDLPADFEVFGQAVDTTLMDLKGGTTNQVLAKNSNADMDFKWVADAAGMTNPMTTTGDTIYSSSGSTPARLGIGTAGQLLAVNSGATAPEWIAPPVAGGMTLLSTTAITAISQISITGIDQTYNQLVIVMENAATSNTGVALQVRFNTNTTSGQYAYVSRGIDGGAVSDFNNASATLIQTGLNISTTANTNSINTVFTIPRYTNTTRKSFTFNTAAISSSSSTQALFIGTGSFLGSAAISSVQFIVGAGTWTAQGNIYIYGVK
jgi:hypothetical protein